MQQSSKVNNNKKKTWGKKVEDHIQSEDNPRPKECPSGIVMNELTRCSFGMPAVERGRLRIKPGSGIQLGSGSRCSRLAWPYHDSITAYLYLSCISLSILSHCLFLSILSHNLLMSILSPSIYLNLSCLSLVISVYPISLFISVYPVLLSHSLFVVSCLII